VRDREREKLFKSNPYNKLCLVLFCGVIKPYHSFLYTELNLKSLKGYSLSNSGSMNSNSNCFLSTGCVYVGVTGQHSSKVCDT